MVSLAFHSPAASRVSPTARRSVTQHFASAMHGLVSEWQVRRTIRALEELDAHLLADMGIPSGSIEAAVRRGR